jgi:hypothetical protein
MKANILAHSSYCHGIVTMISNLVESDDVPLSEMGLETWKQEYINGSNNTIYGMLVPKDYVGLTWAECTLKLYEELSVVLFAAQIEGRVTLNPGNVSKARLDGSEVAFFITYEVPEKLSEEMAKWPDVFLAAKAKFIKPTDSTKLAKPLEVDERDALMKQTEQERRASLKRKTKNYVVWDEVCYHVLIIGTSQGTSNWLQMVMLIDALMHEERAWQHKDLAVLTSDEAPPKVVKRYPQVQFVTGDPLSASALAAAKTEVSSYIIVFSDQGPGKVTREEFKDQHTVLVANSLEAYLQQSDARVSALYDFFTAVSAGFLVEVGKGNFSRKPTQMHTDSEQGITDRTWKKHMDLWRESLRLKSRFACGQLFTWNFVGAMLARDYYVESTIEVIMTLVNCDSQKSLPWLLPVPPEFADKEYGDLVKAWMADADCATPLGIRRFLHHEAEIGIQKEYGYVITNPVKNFKLHATDQVYVLGTASFEQVVNPDDHRVDIDKASQPMAFKNDVAIPDLASRESSKELSRQVSNDLAAIKLEVQTCSQAEDIAGAMTKLRQALEHLERLPSSTSI